MPPGKKTKWLSTVAIGTTLYHLVTASGLLTFAGFFIPAVQFRSVSLFLILVMVYSLLISSTSRLRKKISYGLLLAMGSIGTLFPVLFYDRYLAYGYTGYLDSTGLVIVALLVVSLIGAARLRLGWPIPIIIVVIGCTILFQQVLPGILRGPALSPHRFGFTVYVGSSGIFGIPFAVATTIIITFLVFGAVFEASGGGKWFIDLAMALTGRMAGGPAKASVVASGLFGMLTGSPSSNVATTGVFTIPLMKKYGMSPAFSGAVEAVASSGGMILPPVMGAIAFVMAEWLGIGYPEVVVAAVTPAILYYVVLFISVDFVARRDGLTRDAPAGEKVGAIFKNGWFYLLPIGLLVYLLLFKQLLPAWSALGALPVLIGVSFLSKNPGDHLSLQRVVKAFEGSCYRWLTVGIVTASIGILMGSLELSGLGVRISGFLVNLGAGNLFITLLLVAGASFVLGMGLDALPAYITLAILTAPALVKLGVPPVAAHLFVIYFGLASFITPPVCLAVYTACSITGEDIWKTGLHAVKLGAAIFVVPFAFIYHPGLLLQGSFFEIAKATLTGLAGAAMIAGGLQGYFFWGKCNKTVRAFLTAAGLILIGI